MARCEFVAATHLPEVDERRRFGDAGVEFEEVQFQRGARLNHFLVSQTIDRIADGVKIETLRRKNGRQWSTNLKEKMKLRDLEVCVSARDYDCSGFARY